MKDAQTARKQRTPTNVTPEDVSETEATLAKNIKMYREAFGMTQEEVARAIGTSISSVQHWEQGLKVPRPEWLTSLAKLYGIEVANLFGLKAHKVSKRKRR